MQFQMGFTCLKTVAEPAQIKDEILNHHVANASTLPFPSLSALLIAAFFFIRSLS